MVCRSAPVTNPQVVAVAVARTLGLPDQSGRSVMDTVKRFVTDRTVLMVLDNCEHLLDASGNLVVELPNACAGPTVLATSLEPLGVSGELTWRVPSLSLTDEAMELFCHRARHARPGFTMNDQNAALTTEICRRLDGIVKLLTLFGGCEDWSLWRLRRGTRATGIRSRSSGTRCGCITVSC